MGSDFGRYFVLILMCYSDDILNTLYCRKLRFFDNIPPSLRCVSHAVILAFDIVTKTVQNST